MARKSGIRYVPGYFRSSDESVYIHDGQAEWELTEWLPGSADYLSEPSLIRLRSAVTSLAAIHAVWRNCSLVGPSPAAQQRCEILAPLTRGDEPRQWLAMCRDETERKLVHDTAENLKRHASYCFEQLRQLAQEPTLLHYCIRDVRCEHVLFTGDRVTGLVDFGALRIDEPATDLARLLGTSEPLAHQNWLQGFDFYAEREPTIQRHRVAILDFTSCLLSAVQWARWLIVDRRSFAMPRQELIDRWQSFLVRLRKNNWSASI